MKLIILVQILTFIRFILEFGIIGYFYPKVRFKNPREYINLERSMQEEA